MDLYLDGSNFVPDYYICEMQDRKSRSLIFNLFTILTAKQNYNTYKCALVAIIKFTKKYFYMLNAEYQTVLDTNYKSLVRFFYVQYHDDIFFCLANKLRLLNIRIQHILKINNIVADGLSQDIFDKRNSSSN